jgi:O-methyltransferase
MKRSTASLYLLKAIARIVRPSYRFDWSSFSWQTNSRFNEFLEMFDERNGFNTQRRWMMHELLRLVSLTRGDTAECGVFAGAGSFLICQSNESSPMNKTHHAFDSFEGLSEPKSTIDGSHWKSGDMSVSLDSVKARLLGSNIVYHKGWIPTTFHEVESNQFSFVHIDVDLYQPTRDSVEFFYPRMSDGGIMLFDDYEFDTCPGATRAIDEFFRDKAEKPLALPSGGGFVIVGRSTRN